MFDNIGRKIKTLAKVLCWIGIIVSVTLGIANICMGTAYILQGILIGVLGTLCSWISSFTLYGIGQMIENSDICVSLLQERSMRENNIYDTSETQDDEDWKLLALVKREYAERIYPLFDANHINYYKTDLGMVEIYVAKADFKRGWALVTEEFKDDPKVLKSIAKL